jgi:GTP-binding protein YchF
MRLGIIGLPGAGKATVFEALTGNPIDPAQRMEAHLAMVPVPDARVDALSAMYRPRKTTFARVEYLLPGRQAGGAEKSRDPNPWAPVRDCDALIHVVRNFGVYGVEAPAPWRDFGALNQEMILADLMVVEKRIERLAQDRQRGRKVDAEELDLLNTCLSHLETETPLRRFPELGLNPKLRGFAFVSAKPLLLLFNNEDDDDGLPEAEATSAPEACMVLRGKLEQELAQMSADEAQAFLAEFAIQASAMDRVIARSYDLLGLISFFTVGEDEVRAWTIRRATSALDAAGAIHSDLKQGFIRAEVVSYDDLVAAGSLAEARKQGTLRLEGKTYEVKDGDIVHIRFNV